LARKVAPAALEPVKDGDFERYDVVNFMQRLRLMERVHKLAGWIPPWPVLSKVRSTLDSI
jgi:hypothetical protein